MLFGLWPLTGAANPTLQFCIENYDYPYFNKRINRHSRNYIKPEALTIKTSTGQWNITIKQTEVEYGVNEFEVVFELQEGFEKSSNVGIDLLINDWEKDNYVLLPAAAYNGNRFEWRRIAYSPKLLDPGDIGKEVATIITDVPRLNIKNGFSRIQERSGSMATPGIGYFDKSKSKGFFLLTTQKNNRGDYGINIEENRNRDEAVISLRSPLVREYYKYNIVDNMDIVTDKPTDFAQGDTVAFKFRIYEFNSNEIQDLFNKYAEIRQDITGKPSFRPLFPFSNCFAIQEKKFNTQNFVPDWGYYSVGMRNMFLQDWQIGWTGGMISTYPLLFAGNEESKKNVIRNFDWLFPDGIAPSGFFWDSGEKGNRWYGGDIRKPHTKNWHLIRKSGDGLYYVIKQMLLMRKMGIDIKPAWEKGTKKVADAFVSLWNKEKQFGQFVDAISGKIIVGGSASGAIAPAALCLASDYYREKKYLETAEASAKQMYDTYIVNGITTGGPGDALQNPDSESAYAMLESFALLYEFTGKEQWLNYAENMANQFATWIMAYDYIFPEESLFGKLDMRSTGAVFANTQNKHGSPGICTHSGVALLRLYRATGNFKYLHFLKEIAYNIPQYMSHPDRIVGGMDPGWINERVSTTDWFEGIGEIFPGSTWAETSLMLTYIEIPGIYVDLENKAIICFDHINTTLKKGDFRKALLEIENPTKYSAEIKIFVEDGLSKKSALGENYLLNATIVKLNPGEKKLITVKKN